MTSPRHVVVCGAGVMGAAVAYYLARRGVRVTVVERTGVACAASGKSGGFLALDWCDGSPVGPLARLSFALHAELGREVSADYGYRRMDTYMLAARERGAVAGGHRIPAPALDRRARRRGGGARLARDDGPGPPRPVHHRAARGGPGARRRAAERRGRGRGDARRRGARRDGGRRDARGRRGRPRPGPVDGPRQGPRAAAHPRAQGLQRDARRGRRARPRAVHGLPHRRRPRARAGDHPAARRHRLRVRDGRPAAAAGVRRGRPGERGRLRHAGPRRRARVRRAGRRARSSAGRPATARSPTTASR